MLKYHYREKVSRNNVSHCFLKINIQQIQKMFHISYIVQQNIQPSAFGTTLTCILRIQSLKFVTFSWYFTIFLFRLYCKLMWRWFLSNLTFIVMSQNILSFIDNQNQTTQLFLPAIVYSAQSCDNWQLRCRLLTTFRSCRIHK